MKKLFRNRGLVERRGSLRKRGGGGGGLGHIVLSVFLQKSMFLLPLEYFFFLFFFLVNIHACCNQ